MAQLLVCDLAAVAIAAPQIHRLVVASTPGLVHMTALDPGHMHCTRTLRHTVDHTMIRPCDRTDMPAILATLLSCATPFSQPNPKISTQRLLNCGIGDDPALVRQVRTGLRRRAA